MIMWDVGKFAQSASKFVKNAGKLAKNIGNFLDQKNLNKSNNDHVGCW